MKKFNIWEESKVQEEKKPNKGRKAVLLVLLVVVVAVAAAVICWAVKSKKDGDVKPPNTITSQIVLEEGQTIDKTEAGYFTVQMQMRAISSDGINFVGAIANAYENQNQTYVTIALADTDEQIFESGLLPVGSQIDEFSLDKKLEPGTYDTVLSFHSVEDDGVTEISTVNVQYTLEVSE
jgi:flagellar basal body-associated protein FliL